MAHCFDYLRQGLQCSADSTTEPAVDSVKGFLGAGFPRTCRYNHLPEKVCLFLLPRALAMTSRPSSRGFFWPVSLLILAAVMMSPKLLSLISLIFIANRGVSEPLVQNKHTGVSYHGTSTNHVERFQNIFYAEDTSGSSRFAPPIPYLPPSGTTVDATVAGAWYPQGLGGPPLPFTSLATNVSENCLSLRIARFSGTRTTAKLPVLVWIHGGIRVEIDA